MNCKCVSQRLGGYLDGELAGPEMLAMRNHLNRCDACAEEAESLRSLKSSLSCLPLCAPPDGLEERLLAAIRVEARPTVGRRQLRLYWGFGLAAAAAVGFFSVWLHLPNRTSESAGEMANAVSNPNSFELSRDQAFQAASDPLSGHSMVVTASYGR